MTSRQAGMRHRHSCPPQLMLLLLLLLLFGWEGAQSCACPPPALCQPSQGYPGLPSPSALAILHPGPSLAPRLSMVTIFLGLRGQVSQGWEIGRLLSPHPSFLLLGGIIGASSGGPSSTSPPLLPMPQLSSHLLGIFLQGPLPHDAVSRCLAKTAAHLPSACAHLFLPSSMAHLEKTGPMCPALILPTNAQPGRTCSPWPPLLSVLASFYLSLGLITSTLSLQSLRTGSPGWQNDLGQDFLLFYLLR